VAENASWGLENKKHFSAKIAAKALMAFASRFTCYLFKSVY
jgi:hypothetical protein